MAGEIRSRGGSAALFYIIITSRSLFQQHVLGLLDLQSDRNILFVVDEQGGCGKSAFCKWLLANKKTWACQGGGIRDLMYTYKADAEYAVFDMARCNDVNYWPWNFMENLKNGWFTSTKYQGYLTAFKAPRVLVLTNHVPPRDKLSADRYHVLFVNEFILNKQ